jgi:Flp pilus assembly protein TadD
MSHAADRSISANGAVRTVFADHLWMIPRSALVVCLSLGLWSAPQVCSTSSTCAQEPSTNETGDRQIRDRVNYWVEQLGASNFAQRMRARLELERLGLLAFDALYEAQFAEDSEISLAARYLIGSLQVSWANPEDPDAVRNLLEGYGGLGELDRQARIERLTQLPDHVALPALCRLARFESSPLLSRRAALAVLRMPDPTLDAERQRTTALIQEVLGPNDRATSAWLRLRAEEWLEGNLREEQWREYLAAEREELNSGGQGTITDQSLVRDLYWSVAERAAKLEMQAATEFALDSLDLIPSEDLAVVDAVTWALNHRIDGLIERLYAREGNRFEQEPRLLYGLADVARRNGLSERAKQLADQARGLAPPPTDGSSELLDEALYRHTEMGILLQERGWFDWEKRELQLVIDAAPLDSLPSARARIQLASLHEALEEFPAAIQTLEPLIKRIQADDAFATRVKDLLLVSEPSELVSRWYYLQGLQAINTGDTKSAGELLLKATEQYPDNIEALIAMYRLPGDAGWQTRRQLKVAASAKRLREAIDWLSRMLNTQQAGADRAGTAAFLAMRCNQYAWLIANTEGDMASAVEYSQKALELQPGEPAYLDTLARSLFAGGDLNGAIEAQRRAVAAEPHWPPLQRQMEFFQQQAEGKAAGAPPP